MILTTEEYPDITTRKSRRIDRQLNKFIKREKSLTICEG